MEPLYPQSLTITPSSNHTTDLLIYSDWLEDNNQSELSTLLREEITEEPEIPWCYEYRNIGVGSSGDDGGVTGSSGGVASVGAGIAGVVDSIVGSGTAGVGSIGSIGISGVGGGGGNN